MTGRVLTVYRAAPSSATAPDDAVDLLNRAAAIVFAFDHGLTQRPAE